MISYGFFSPDSSTAIWPVHSLEHVSGSHRTCSMPSMHSKTHWFKPCYCLNDVWATLLPCFHTSSSWKWSLLPEGTLSLPFSLQISPLWRKELPGVTLQRAPSSPGELSLTREYYSSHPLCPKLCCTPQRKGCQVFFYPQKSGCRGRGCGEKTQQGFEVDSGEKRKKLHKD